MDRLSVPNSKSPNMQQLIEDYGDSMLRVCFLYLRDMHLAEDALQEAFIKIYQNWSNFRGECSEKTWITRVVINVCRSQLRSTWLKRVTLSSRLEDESCDNAVLADDTVLKEISKLKPKYKEVILLFYYQEMKAKEIAAAFDLSESTVSVRLGRAREQLKKQLKGWYFDD